MTEQRTDRPTNQQTDLRVGVYREVTLPRTENREVLAGDYETNEKRMRVTDLTPPPSLPPSLLARRMVKSNSCAKKKLSALEI